MSLMSLTRHGFLRGFTAIPPLLFGLSQCTFHNSTGALRKSRITKGCPTPLLTVDGIRSLGRTPRRTTVQVRQRGAAVPWIRLHRRAPPGRHHPRRETAALRKRRRGHRRRGGGQSAHVRRRTRSGTRRPPLRSSSSSRARGAVTAPRARRRGPSALAERAATRR